VTPQRIILIGYRATGKTATAKALAQKLAWRWFDSDAEIAKEAGRDLATIFREDGELEFRRRESAVLRRLVRKARVVLATGGGAILVEANRQLLKAAGPVFWLTATADVIRRRLAADGDTSRNRPALTGTDAISEVDELLASRQALYQSCADYVVATDQRTAEEVAIDILEQLQKGGR
jgi:shikimate kinase